MIPFIHTPTKQIKKISLFYLDVLNNEYQLWTSKCKISPKGTLGNRVYKLSNIENDIRK
jgi:hypothetical protein